MALLFPLLAAFDVPDDKLYTGRKVVSVSVNKASGDTALLLGDTRGLPVILSPVYTRCPSACSLISGGLKRSIQSIGPPGEEYMIITFSFDHNDSAEDLKGFEERWGMDGITWKTVNADSMATARLLESIDYHFDYDPQSGEYAHPNVTLVLTPSGRISRYIYGVEPKARDLELALMEASLEKTSSGGGGSWLRQIYIKCFAFDPGTKTYHLEWKFIIQTSAGILILAIMGTLLVRSLFFSKRKESPSV